MSGKMESQNSYSSFKSESEVSHSVTTTTAYPETTYTRYSHQRTKIKSPKISCTKMKVELKGSELI